MELIADILLVAGALGAGLYCHVLARRLSRFNDLENGVGGAVAVGVLVGCPRVDRPKLLADVCRGRVGPTDDDTDHTVSPASIRKTPPASGGTYR